jgi:hypothetical protein
VPDALAVLLFAVAFIYGFNASHDLEWGNDLDHLRDVAAAQTILDGHLWNDQYYAEESLWYNPLVPTLVAAAAGITGAPVPVVHIRLGAYIDLLPAICFYILVTRFFNRYVALASTACFLFFTSAPSHPTWASATYSPMLLPVIFVQTGFYLTLFVYWKAICTRKRRYYAATGALLGITFLGHTAPALILGGIITLFTLTIVYQDRKQVGLAPAAIQAVTEFGILIVMALVVSAPYLYTILGRYRLRIVNPWPSNWVWAEMGVENLSSFIEAQFAWPIFFVVLFGLAYFIFSKVAGSVEKRLLLFWLITSLVFLAYSYFQQILGRNGVEISAITPGFHFLVYVEAFKAVMFGIGLLLMVRAAQWVFRSLRRIPHLEPVALVSLTFVCLWLTAPDYVRRDYFGARDASLGFATLTDQIQAYQWIRQHTQPRDVFLSHENLALFAVGQAGRKVIAVSQFFSNPYVDWGTRNWDNEAMFDYLYAGDWQGFVQLATRYNVRYVIVDSTEERGTLDGLVFLVRMFNSGTVTIYRAVFSPIVEE